MHPVLILVLMIATLILVSWLKRAPPAARTKALITLGVVAIVILAATGRLNWIFAAVAAALAVGQRLLAATQLFSHFKSMRGPTPGKSSDVETGFIRMSLNHDTGEMSGEVLKGQFENRSLETLTMAECLTLHTECSHEDQQSVAVLEAYLDRRFGEEWRDQADARPGSSRSSGDSTMSKDEAREILGVTDGARSDEIIEAHRRLMQKMHPDRGGSTFLAAQINQAKDLLLGA